MTQSIQLEQYLGTPMTCSCGHEHKTLLKRIDIEKGALKRLPAHIQELGYHHIFMVCDVNTWQAAGKMAADLLHDNGIDHECLIIQEKELVPDEHAVGTVITAFPKKTDLILAVGSGTLNDLCKFISYQLDLDYMVCATAPSMDGFASIGAALITNHVKTTYDAHVPVAIIGDTEVLSQAPMEMIVAGLGDILGKYTCLMDWKMAHLIEGEYYCEKIAGMVKQAVKIVVEQSSKIKDRDLEAVKAITEALALTGVAMSFVGNSRPASGSEHHLSHYWEMQFQMEGKKPILHGIKVGVGLLTVLKMYDKLAQENIDFSSLKDMKFDKAAWEEKIRECYKEAADGILALEESCGKNSAQKRLARLERLEEVWPEMVSLISTELPVLEELEQLMVDLGEPINPQQLGISMKQVKDGIVLAKEVRNRFTILQILWDLGLLEQYAKDMATYFQTGQKAYLDHAASNN
ncbi:MAG: sn-glycerol-1-phosphate dehydrogenase [Lachnospiraceae bacterium]|nr:sn-glycerol-1-phosphate dehydrogenase [Lachnospiraceae bacterium]